MEIGEVFTEEEISDFHYILKRVPLFPCAIKKMRTPTAALDKFAVSTILKSGFQAKSNRDGEWAMYLLNKSGEGLHNANGEWVGISSAAAMDKFIGRWRPTPLEAQEARLRQMYPEGVYEKNRSVEEEVILNPAHLVMVPVVATPVWMSVEEEKPVEFEYPVTVDAYKELDPDRASMVLEDARFKSGWMPEDMSTMVPREIPMREMEHVIPKGEWALVPEGPVVWVNQWRDVRYVITQDLRVYALAHKAPDSLTEGIVGDTVIVTDVLWSKGNTVTQAPLRDRLRYADESMTVVQYGNLGRGRLTDRWVQKSIRGYWTRGVTYWRFWQGDEGQATMNARVLPGLGGAGVYVNNERGFPQRVRVSPCEDSVLEKIGVVAVREGRGLISEVGPAHPFRAIATLWDFQSHVARRVQSLSRDDILRARDMQDVVDRVKVQTKRREAFFPARGVVKFAKEDRGGDGRDDFVDRGREQRGRGTRFRPPNVSRDRERQGGGGRDDARGRRRRKDV